MKYLSAPLLLTISFAACQSPSDKIVRDFKKVDSSMEKSNRLITQDDSLSFYYLSIQAKKAKNETLARKADSLYQRMQNTTELLTKAEDLLQQKDSAGDNTHVIAGVLVNTPLGDSVRATVRDIAARCRAAVISPDKRDALNHGLHLPEMLIEPDQWNGSLFAGEPTVAGLTVLASLRLNCAHAVILTLADLEAHF